ncbi:TonB-dependent receptor [uncultured Sphingopyxis sp.]|uniref:TonB-dependent receptor n=1 Tax=uncultured Sphingopyxis sp. TaxID=310581 RepID=A0A1Y5PWF2_9SPHN|nr:TonB-dependent receptor [uncultured Sphingopyxis sp.]SBV33016.1 TonB-dependent receptor [uncultured Sphingopyxis sp.]
MNKSHLFLGAAAFAVAISVSQPVLAQDTAPADTAEATDDNTERSIVVTGSRIVRPTLDSPVPLTSVDVSELTDTGDVSLGDALNDLPSLRSTFSQGNSTRFIGTAGLNILDLRGLGTSRTLVLVNGKRHITASPGDYLVDVNTIPVDLLERVDIVTGGNSAIYGSDAVAGVVNFITKRDFEGINLRAQGGLSSRGDRGNVFISGTYGKNFADGRGNIAVSAEYAESNPLYFTDRDKLTGAYSGRCQFQTVEPTGGELNGSDGITDTEFVCGVKNGSISDGGTLGRVGPGQYLRFGPNGDLFVDVPDGDFEAGGSANILGGQGSTLRNTGQLAAGLKRYAVNLLAHYDVSDAFRPFIEAKYVRVDAIQEGQPSFFQGSLAGFFATTQEQFDAIPELRCDNPFLTTQAFSTLSSYGVCGAAPDATPFTISRFNPDFGGRGEKHKRETYRVVAGVEGTFNDDWEYEIALNYGRFESSMKSLNNLVLFDEQGNLDGFLLAIDSVRNTNGQIVCRVNADADPTNDRPDCVPINVFGYGAPSQAALDFVNTTALRKEKAEEFVATASVAGDLSQLFELPGGPIGFALGGEYREEKASSVYDDLTASGGTFLNAIQPFTPPKLSVKEAFAEVSVPLLANVPLAEELTISAAARVSDYNTSAGTVWAYNVQGLYAPIPDIRLRAAYAKSVRTPTQSDLYSPFSQNFAQLSDPCDSANITNDPNRVANCAAAGVPTVFDAASAAACAGTSFPEDQREVGDPWVNCIARTSSTSYRSGGNPTLQNEIGKSLTLGAVIEPSFLPGFNFTVDYYKIKVKSLISALSAQTIINLCYDSATGIDNPFCATVNREATGFFDQQNGAVISGGVNFAAQKTEGIDFDLAYRRTFDNGHRLSFRAIATYLMRLDNYTDPTNPEAPNRQMSELGDPRWAANASINYDFGALDLSWSVRYIGKQTIGTWETQNSYKGACPADGTIPGGGSCIPGAIVTLPPTNADAYPRIYYPDALYHNLRANLEIDNKFDFYIGVDNAFDKQPPLGLLGTAGGDPYDTFGRYFYAGIKASW